MDTQFTKRTDLQQASVIREGLDWCRTYGQRSAYAYLLHRNVPRERVARILDAQCRRSEDLPDGGLAT